MPLSPGKPFKTKTRLGQNPEKQTKKQFRCKNTPPTEIVNDETVVWGPLLELGGSLTQSQTFVFCGSVVLSSQLQRKLCLLRGTDKHEQIELSTIYVLYVVYHKMHYFKKIVLYTVDVFDFAKCDYCIYM